LRLFELGIVKIFTVISPKKSQFRLSLEEASSLQDYLVRRGFSEASGTVTVETAGEGNMNCVLRVRTAKRSLIVKQARPWVEKYPSIAAPVERAAAEARFYEAVAGDHELSAVMPKVLDFDAGAAVLILEDLSPAEPLMDCYAGKFALTEDQLNVLAGFLRRLHGVKISAAARPAFRNAAMRKLNHEHIFDLPLRKDGGLGEMREGITPGLEALAEGLREDAAYVGAVRELGKRYLKDDGGSLLHGDFFPGSLLLRDSGQLCVIDPEFSFCGDPEFDIGVFQAHLLLSGHTEEMVEFWMEAALDGTEGDRHLVRQYAGVEVMRRLIGVAQLPMERTPAEKRLLLERSREWVLG